MIIVFIGSNNPFFRLCGLLHIDVLKVIIVFIGSNIFLLFSGEPNNDSPLNTQAASMWSDQPAYKEYLHKKYQEEQQKESPEK